MSATPCDFCGKPATCYGSYEGAANAYACDDCCGHGQEDGKCSPVDRIPTLSARLVEALIAAREGR